MTQTNKKDRKKKQTKKQKIADTHTETSIGRQKERRNNE